MTTKELLAQIGPGLTEVLNNINDKDIDAVVDAIVKANRVFTAGWGRAGNIVRILGMDLSQFGKQVYCVGDNSTPSIHKGDLLIVVSGSGNTKSINVLVEQAKSYGAEVALICSHEPASETLIGQSSDYNIVVPERYDMIPYWEMEAISDEENVNKNLGQHIRYNLTPEQREQVTMDKFFGFYEAAFILNEVIQQKYMEKIGADFEDIFYYHNNLE